MAAIITIRDLRARIMQRVQFGREKKTHKQKMIEKILLLTLAFTSAPAFNRYFNISTLLFWTAIWMQCSPKIKEKRKSILSQRNLNHHQNCIRREFRERINRNCVDWTVIYEIQSGLVSRNELYP